MHITNLAKYLVPAALLLAGCGSKDIGPSGGSGGGGSSIGSSSENVGSVISPWKQGMLDLHFINTTAGECTFIILPDGTQFLVDAAGAMTPTGGSSIINTEIRSRWDPRAEGVHYGKFIADYIKKCMKWTGNYDIDYALLTHFHNDHFGGVSSAVPVSDCSDTYKQQSFAYLMDTFKIGLLMDRGYPNYDYPFDMATKAVGNADNCSNYITAVKWHVSNKGLKAEMFKAGSADQIVLKHSPEKYPDCIIQNLVVNGELWTGSGTATVKRFPDKSKISGDGSNAADNCPNENSMSAAFRLSYGKFDAFLGGDLCYNGSSSLAWKDIETPTAQVCGKVEVLKADHHGVTKTHGCGADGGSAMKYFQPQVWVVNTWADTQPRPDKLTEVSNYLPLMDIFITNMAASTFNTVGATIASRIRGKDGHCLVRVDEGGGTFNVYMLADSDRSMKVQSISGPYKCK